MSLGGREKGIPTLVDVLFSTRSGGISPCGGVNMTRLLVLAGLAVMLGIDTVAMRGAEAAGDPLALDSCLELGKLLGVGGGAGGCGSVGIGSLATMLAIFLAVMVSDRVLLVATRLSRTTFSLAAASARASMPLANCSSKEGAIAPPAKSSEGLVWWKEMAAEAEPKTSEKALVARCSRSTVCCVVRAQVFQAAHVLRAGARASRPVGTLL